MKISDSYHDIILNEFNEVEKLCNEASSPDDKLYFFTASFGVINRIMNLYCDPTLIFMHNILKDAHQAIANRLTISKNPENISSSLPKDMWDSLFYYFSELKLAFEKKDEVKIREVLEKFSNLIYATSGNGFYLYLRKKLVL
jgi:hypothetical protein